MNNKRIYPLFIFFLVSTISLAGSIYSFEVENAPAEFTASNGSLSISSSKAKLGDKSLRWQYNAGSILTANNPADLATVCKISTGGINTWVYNTQKSDKTLKFAFYDDSNTEQCSIDFKLDFEGWRCLWAIFRTDMGFNPNLSTLQSMKIIAPDNQSGDIYIDYLEFVNNVSWERISDSQYTLKHYNENIVSFLDIRNTPQPSPISPSSEQLEALTKIEKRLNDWYLGTGSQSTDAYYKLRESAMNSYINAAKNRIGNLNLSKETDGTVKGLGLFPVTYQGLKIDGISVTTFRNISETYLIQLAYDHRRTGNTTSLSTMKDIYDWYYNQGWADGSGMGSLRFEMLRSAGFYHSVFLMKDQLNDEQFNRMMDAIRWYSMQGSAYSSPKTAGELADYIRTLAIPKLIYSISIKDEAQRNANMQAYQKYFKNAIGKAPGFKGTFKPDYSGYHHNGPYYSAYYPDALYTACFVYYLLHDTPYALGEDVYQDLKQALLTFRFLAGKYNIPAATTGRFPAQQTIVHQVLPAFAYLGLSATTPDAELQGAFGRLWDPASEPMLSYIKKVKTDICFSSSMGEVELLLDFAKTTSNAEANPTGRLYMPYSGLLVARQANWMLTAKGMSKYIWDYESSTSENIYGRYLSYGQLEYTDLDNNNSSYKPSNADWNWNHIPGTTSKSLSYTNLDFNKANGKHRNLSDKTFLGGIALDTQAAMFSNQVHDNAIDNSFFADKSTFVFDNLVYCLGSGINSKSTTTPVYTTLFQNELKSGFDKVYINNDEYTADLTAVNEPIIKDNYGNVFIVEQGSATIKKNNTCMLAYLDHGKIIADKKYAYAWLIKPSEEQIANYISKSPIEILSQDAISHAVYHNDTKTLAISAFSTDNPIDIRQIYSLSKPMTVMLRENSDNTLDLAFSDPDMNRDSAPRGDDISLAVAAQSGGISEVVVTLNGKFEKHSGDEHVTVTITGDKTSVKYPYAQDGKTYKVKLKQGGLSINNEEQDRTGFYISHSMEYITISSENTNSFDYTVFDLTGRILSRAYNNYASVKINKSELSNGVSIVRVSDKKREQNFKISN